MAFSNGDVLALLCWPVIAAGVLLLAMLRRKGDRLEQVPRKLLTFVAAAAVIIPLILVTWYATLSAAMLINQYLLVIVTGGVLLAVLHRRWTIDPAWRVAAMALASPALIAVGMWTLIGDYAMPRQYLDGMVTRTSHRIKVRRPDRYFVDIDGRDFATTAEVYDRIHSGQRIRAEIGAGSHTVLDAKPE